MTLEKLSTTEHLENLSKGRTEKFYSDEESSQDVESVQAQDSTSDNKKTVRSIMRKVDMRLLPALGLLYMIAMIDRSNLALARLAGMDKELGTNKGNRYSILTMMFFVTYILFELPSNLALRHIGAARWLGMIGFFWGVLTLGAGFTKTWGELLVCRIIFGAFEGGLFPGCVYLISCWYTRFEIQKRFVGFYVLGSMSNGFGSLLAYGIQEMHGLAGYAGWRWIFIIEGIISCIIAIGCILFLIDFPERAAKPHFLTRKTFLNEAEVGLILGRLQNDRGDAIPEQASFKAMLKHLKDWKVWEFGMLILCNNMTGYSYAFFLPLILRGGLGYSQLKTYVLCFPPYVLGGLWMLAMAYLGDRIRMRGPIIAFNAVLSVIGACMMAFLDADTPRYIGAFLGVAFTQCNIPAIYAYQHNNLVGNFKRAVSTAVIVAMGGVGGIIASNVFRQQDAPTYLPGMITVMVSQALTVVLVVKNFWVFSWANKKAEKLEHMSENGERSPNPKEWIEGVKGFRYTL